MRMAISVVPGPNSPAFRSERQTSTEDYARWPLKPSCRDKMELRLKVIQSGVRRLLPTSRSSPSSPDLVEPVSPDGNNQRGHHSLQFISWHTRIVRLRVLLSILLGIQLVQLRFRSEVCRTPNPFTKASKSSPAARVLDFPSNHSELGEPSGRSRSSGSPDRPSHAPLAPNQLALHSACDHQVLFRSRQSLFLSIITTDSIKHLKIPHVTK